MNELISVVIPVYNAAPFLDACMESVLGQTYTNTEILLIDDGSTDGSGEMCERYAAKDGRVRVAHKENGGASSARNAGLSLAKGTYLYFLDSDDHIEPELLRLLYENAEQNGSDLVFFDAWALNADTGEKSERNYSHRERYLPAPGAEMMRRKVKNGDFHVGVWQLFYRTAFLREHGLRFLEGVVFEDYLFACQVYCLASRVSYVPEFLYTRVYHAGSVMTRKRNEHYFYSAVRVWRGVCAFNAENRGDVPQAYLVRGAYNALNCYSELSAKEKQRQKPLLYEIKREIRRDRAFGDRALAARCVGYWPWAAYRMTQKLIKKR